VSYDPEAPVAPLGSHPHDGPGREGVPERVEVHVVQPGHLHGVVIGGLDVATLEDAAIALWTKADQRIVGLSVERDPAAPAALGQLQADDTPTKIHPLPGQAQQLVRINVRLS
jgi:hypothetical protein